MSQNCFRTFKKELARIIAFYNDKRPHMSIGNQTPSVAHTQTKAQQRMWRNPWENADPKRRVCIFAYDYEWEERNQYRYRNQMRLTLLVR